MHLKPSFRHLAQVVTALTTVVVLSACGSPQQPAAKAPASAAPASAAPAAAAPAAAANNKLVVFDSVVRGSANLKDDEKALRSCVLNSKFMRNEQIVWRMKVVDPATGKELDDKDMASVKVKLGDGKTLDGKFGLRPKDKPIDGFWTTSFTIPEDYTPGTLNYSIEAVAKDGRAGQFITFTVASSALTVLPEIRAKVAAKK